MERLTRDEYLMEVAHVVARRGTCSRAQVGVVFAREGRIVATGYNGAPPGVPHCTHESYKIPTLEQLTAVDPWPEVPQWLEGLPYVQQPAGTVYYFDGRTVSNAPGCTVVSHAERNGIAFAAREGIALRDTVVFCTHAPCIECARSLLSAGIRSLVFKTPYRLTAGVEFLHEAGVEVFRVWPNSRTYPYPFGPQESK